MNTNDTTRIAGVLLALAVLAITPLAQAKDTPWTSISSLEIQSEGNLFLDPTNSVINPANCKNNSAYALGKSHAAFTRIYALLLNAYRKNSEVKLNISKKQCVKSRPKINGAAVR